MPRACRVCTHPKRAAIEQSLARGDSNRRIADTYGFDKASLKRHVDNHLEGRLPPSGAEEAPQPPRQARQEARRLETIEDLAAIAEEVLAEMLPGTREASEDRRGAAACAGQALKALDLVARLRGLISRGGGAPGGEEAAPAEAPIFRVDLSEPTRPEPSTCAISQTRPADDDKRSDVGLPAEPEAPGAQPP